MRLENRMREVAAGLAWTSLNTEYICFIMKATLRVYLKCLKERGRAVIFCGFSAR